MLTAPEPKPPGRMEQLAAITSFVLIGPTLIFLNQHLLVSKQFKYPGALTGMGVFASLLVSHGAVLSGKLKLEHKELLTVPFYLRRIMPIGCAQAGTIVTGNLAYLSLSVAFIQILKSFAPVILVACLLLARLEQLNLLLFVSITVISIGSMGAVKGELRFDYFGFWMMIASEVIEAVKLVCQQQLLGSLKFSVLEGMYWISPAAVFWLASYSCVFEGADMAQNGGFQIFCDNVLLFLCCALLGLGVNYTGFWVSKCCSALTLKMVSIGRNIGIVLLSPVLLGDLLSAEEFGWYMVSTCGIGLYQYIRMYPEVTEVYTLQRLCATCRRFGLGSTGESDVEAVRLLLREDVETKL